MGYDIPHFYQFSKAYKSERPLTILWRDQFNDTKLNTIGFVAGERSDNLRNNMW